MKMLSPMGEEFTGH